MVPPMCRNIRTLHNFDPPSTDEEVHAAALQYVRKVSGYNKPPKANEQVFDAAVAELAEFTRRLVDSLVATSPPKNREDEAEKKRAKWREREQRMRAGS